MLDFLFPIHLHHFDLLRPTKKIALMQKYYLQKAVVKEEDNEKILA